MLQVQIISSYVKIKFKVNGFSKFKKIHFNNKSTKKTGPDAKPDPAVKKI